MPDTAPNTRTAALARPPRTRVCSTTGNRGNAGSPSRAPTSTASSGSMRAARPDPHSLDSVILGERRCVFSEEVTEYLLGAAVAG